MDKDIQLWLHDMLAAIDEIFDFLPEPRNFIEFENDLKTRRAVERNIEIPDQWGRINGVGLD